MRPWETLHHTTSSPESTRAKGSVLALIFALSERDRARDDPQDKTIRPGFGTCMLGAGARSTCFMIAQPAHDHGSSGPVSFTHHHSEEIRFWQRRT
ncbi:hypothetical protein CCUS01_14093 [Colletotrichum cuscutae]|uniref:Uncharacterized protein n=1 Tax=Colletotrichum cuscutae TaxID=1209917 RepID=A0AAI9Y9Z8_9PEZI|nr:hypothetical protein CCUS01_14093 [Colletotrichum cuscutae]